MQKPDRERIQHMLDATERILEFAGGMDLALLRKDNRTAFAIVHLLEILGEAANHVSEGEKRATPGIPWRDIVDTRHRLIHGYFTIDIETVWKTVAEDLPPLRENLRKILNA
ncbi:MAG: DUF86 domain-containing protein [Euryarchaeota archaeon]|nr:DUF86 domain-containing protein [Euryarchaeota archaeon]